MKATDFETSLASYNLPHQITTKGQAPSNIALVKYWGKTEPQIPTNASISYTLSNCFTKTHLKATQKGNEKSCIKVFLDEKKTPSFVPKIQKFFDRINVYAPYLSAYDFEIHTQNSFPHSSGIASSASGMAALSFALLEMESQMGVSFSENEKLQRASFLSRLGSGSACRSIYNGLVVWGEHEEIDGSSNLFAVPYADEVHEVFQSFQDTILLIHEGQKSVSSTNGHQLMHHHPYAPKRFEQANKNLGQLKPILASGDLEAFGELVEHEALSLHAMMLMSSPAFILMKPATVAVLEKIWQFRKEQHLPLYFTLDAGANVHLLYPKHIAEKAQLFINEELLPHCQNKKAVWDKVAF